MEEETNWICTLIHPWYPNLSMDWFNIGLNNWWTRIFCGVHQGTLDKEIILRADREEFEFARKRRERLL
jgi:hypothetical protein